jgi:hypothetical protein
MVSGLDSPKRQTITVHAHETMNAGWEVERTWARKVRGRKMVKNGEKMVLDKTLMTGIVLARDNIELDDVAESDEFERDLPKSRSRLSNTRWGSPDRPRDDASPSS